MTILIENEKAPPSAPNSQMTDVFFLYSYSQNPSSSDTEVGDR